MSIIRHIRHNLRQYESYMLCRFHEKVLEVKKILVMVKFYAMLRKSLNQGTCVPALL